MKHPILVSYAALFLLVALFSGCARQAENASNANGPQANNNSGQQPPSTSNGTPLAVQPIPQPAKPVPDAAKPAEKPPTDHNANTANASTASDARVPKLVAPDKQINFGKQPQDKTMVRAITIKNAGRAALNIESVTPS